MEGSKFSLRAGFQSLASPSKAKEVDDDVNVSQASSSRGDKTPILACDIDEANNNDQLKSQKKKKKKKKKGSTSTNNHPTQRKGVWTEEEHNLFIKGYEMYGRKWKSISSDCVKSRTKTQVATHARAYFKQQAAQKCEDVVDEYLDLSNFPSIFD